MGGYGQIGRGQIGRVQAVKARSGRFRCGAAGFGGYGSVRLGTERKAWRFGTGEAWWGMAGCSMAVGARQGVAGSGKARQGG